jgi:hypothetical protein
VRRSVHRLRSLLVALALLALTAGAALAGSPGDHATKGLGIAAAASGHAVPVASTNGDQTEATGDDTDGEAATDQAGDPPTHPDNHGAVVSAAAKADTPEGYDNHGAYVSSIAKANHGQSTKPATAGKPEAPGKPSDAGAPAGN